MLRSFVLAYAILPATQLHFDPGEYDGSRKVATRKAPRLSGGDLGAGCWEEDVLGKEQFKITRAMCEKAMSNVGDMSKLHRVVQMLAEKSCVNVAALGGSITCGHHTNGTKYGKMTEAYPEKLKQWLNQKFPCHGVDGRDWHDVRNLCHAGQGSQHWADAIASWRGNGQHPLWSADLVIMEAGVNDMYTSIQQIGYYTELILLQLLSSPRDPAVVYLEASFKGATGRDQTPPFHFDAANAHLPVLQYYDVTQISVFNAMTPFYQVSRRKWLQKYFFGDDFHPNSFGHKVLAQLLIHALSSAGSKIDAAPEARGEWFVGAPDDNSKRPLLQVSQEVAARYVQAHWLHLELSQTAQVQDLVKGHTAFLVKEDVPGKPGLLADKVGSSVLLASAFKRSNRKSDMAVNIGILKSYQGMGVMDVTLKVSPGTTCSWELAQTAKVVKDGMRVDCQWPERVSIKDVVPVTLKASRHLPEEGCLFTEFTIVEASPSRMQNKVKLLDLTLSL